jgi:serine/threonine protein kinase
MNVAIKEIRPDEFEDSLITEIVLLKNLEHKNIIKSFGYSIDHNGNFFILTELMQNGCLSDYTNKNPKKKLKLEEKFSVLIDICYGMSFLHSKETPIIHRGK